VLLAAPSGVTGPPDAEVPHRRGRLVIDGDLADWRDAGARVRIERPPAGTETPGTAEVRLAWDRERLLVAFRVRDATPAPAPTGASGPALFQWDSVEIYLDTLGDHTERMGSDDFQVIVSSQGGTAVLQGDPLLAEVESMSVPKRDRPGVAIETVARIQADGYAIEVALPFSALGMVPRKDLEIGIDLALNDWTAPHSPLPMFTYNLQTVRAMADKRLESSPAQQPEAGPNGLTGEAANAFERAHYRPWAWSGSADFGHPARWHRLRLTGGPPFAERVSRTWGPQGLAVIATLVGGLGAGFVALGFELHHRRRIVALLERLALLEPAADGGAIEPTPAAPLARERPDIHVVESLKDRLAATARAGERNQAPEGSLPLSVRAVSATRARLAEPLSPGELARLLFVSLRTLERALSESLACSPREMIVAVKMEAARGLLEAGVDRVQDVAARVGFEDPAHFTRRFKAYFGRPPAAVARRRGAGGVA
jgi:AraC-like DNA-binding protein